MTRVGLAITLLFTSLTTNLVAAKTFFELEPFPEWFQKAMKREKDVSSSYRLILKEFNVNAKVTGKIKQVDQGDGVWYYHIDIGTDAPVECYVFTDYDGAANSLYSVMEQGLQGAAELNKQALSARFNYALDAGVIGDTPYLQLETLFTVGEGDKKRNGLLKGMSAETGRSLEICMHNELGYRETFKAVFTSFVEAFKQNDVNSDFYHAVYQLTLNDIPVGYSNEQYTKDAEGDIEVNNKSAFLFPVDQSNISRSDSVSTSWSTPDGALINGSSYTVRNSTLASSFSIGFVDDAWTVQGEMQGKPVNVTMEYDDWLLSEYGTYLAQNSLANSDQSEATYHMWSPDADPTNPIPVVVSQIDSPDANFMVDLGAINMKYLSDKNGIVRKGKIEQGAVVLNMVLMHVSGSPLNP